MLYKFGTLREATQYAHAQGVIDSAENERLRQVNYKGNLAKHEFGGRR